ncbi:hypothetical protein PDM92_21165 [Bacillus cereus]|nr:hypothetical protein [Bacillus cereus]
MKKLLIALGFITLLSGCVNVEGQGEEIQKDVNTEISSDDDINDITNQMMMTTLIILG